MPAEHSGIRHKASRRCCSSTDPPTDRIRIRLSRRGHNRSNLGHIPSERTSLLRICRRTRIIGHAPDTGMRARFARHHSPAEKITVGIVVAAGYARIVRLAVFSAPTAARRASHPRLPEPHIIRETASRNQELSVERVHNVTLRSAADSASSPVATGFCCNLSVLIWQ